MFPILPCADLDEAIAFYAALGFDRTYRQLRPNPYAVVRRGEMQVHLAAIDGFEPAGSVCSVIIVVPDMDSLYTDFAAGLRAAYGRLPAAGIPRLLRIRRKQGTATGFTLVDVGGNWLRFYASADIEAEDGGDGAADGGTAPRSTGLARALEVAARQGDAHGDEERALAVMERGIARHPEAPAVDLVRARLYAGELLIRLGRRGDAGRQLAAAVDVPLTGPDGAAVAADLEHVRRLVAESGGPPADA